jgi:hypothetical protein
MMFVVFWLEVGYPNHKKFNAAEMTEALKFMEHLRAYRRSGDDISHVCLQGESPDSVGEAGVAAPAADYAWYKRRQDPAEPVGREIFTTGE